MELDYPNIEHIVVDSASTDGTAELLKQYEKKYRLRWISEPDKNQTEGVNKGLRMAKGEFVAITHDDDWWGKGGISVLMKEFESDHSLDLVYGDSISLFPNGKEERVYYKHYGVDDMINGGYQIPQHGCIFKRAWLDNVGFLDERIHHVAEYELFLRIIRGGGRHLHVPKVIGVGFQHGRKESWICWGHSWDETRRVNRAHGGRFFSTFTLIYIQNRFLRKPFLLLKKYFPSLVSFVKKLVRPPIYTRENSAPRN